MSKEKFKASESNARADPGYEKGMQIIESRLRKAKEVYDMGQPELRSTFSNHIHPIILEGIRLGLISPRTIAEGNRNSEAYRNTLLVMDVLLWHVFNDSGIVPTNCLRDPRDEKFYHEYITSFYETHSVFNRLRELDNAPGYDGQAYAAALFPNAEQKKPNIALIARLLDYSGISDETVLAYVISEGIDAKIIVPTAEEWEEKKRNLAYSGLHLYSSLADRLGLSELARRIKDFSVRQLYPEIWEYALYEMNRVCEKVEKSDQIVEEIGAELKRKLKEKGIIAKIVRREGKSPGSLGLKAKGRTEEIIKLGIMKLCIPEHNIDYLEIVNPKKSVLANRNASPRPIRFSLLGAEMNVWFDNEENRLLFNHGHGPSSPLYTSDMEPTNSPFVLAPVEKIAHDLAAGRIIILGYEKKNGRIRTDEATLTKKAYEAGDILAGCIHNVLRKHGITNFDSKTKDHIKEPKKTGYRAIHTDTSAEGIIPFEWQIMSKGMYVYSEEGGAAHCLYKAGGLTPEQTGIIVGIKEIVLTSSAESSPEKDRGEKLVKFTVKIGKKKQIRQLPEGRLVIDALEDAGVELSKVASLEVNGERKRILHIPLTGSLTVDVTYTNNPEEAIMKKSLATQMLKICRGQVTKKQLREIINGNGRKK